jgi:oligopeptidase B
MKKIIWITVTLLGASCMHNTVQYPHPEKIPHSLSKFDDKREDSYFWMRERENPKVLAHLKAENAYAEEIMKPVKKLEGQIFEELKSRVKEDESSAPYPRQGYFYYSRFEAGKQYPIYARKHGSLDAKEEVVLDVNELAKGHSFFECTGPIMSPNQEWAAYAADTVGRRFYTIHFKNLKTGQTSKHTIKDVTPNMTWAADNKTVFYTAQNHKTLRSDKVIRYNIESHASEDVYFESDETYSLHVYSSLSKKYIYILSGSTLTTEVRYLPSDQPQGLFKIFTPRVREHEYSVTDGGDVFYITTNKDNAKNYKLMTATPGHTDSKEWKELIPHRTETYLEGVSVFKNHLVLSEREKGLTQLAIRDRQGKNPFLIPFPDQSYLASDGANAEFDTEVFRYDYESMRLPETTYDFNMKTHEQKLVKSKEVPNYNAELYRAERIFITVRDGTKVPVSLLMKKDFKPGAKAPMLVYGYGSYGANMDPWFSSNILSLVDRGFIFAKAHIRGGSEMGRDWYDNGRTLTKKNTFYDFIDATEGLGKLGYGTPGHLYAMGGSAGGLLMGAVMNMRPDLYKGVVAQVPFVDVISTMLDETIPLTTGEYDEWGNPNEKKYYDYIRTYSPYDNVEKKPYPNTLVTTGFHDSQVQYWEPAKWVAKLREMKTSDSVILLKTELEAGHGGASGRFDRLKEIATEYAFILMIEENIK